MSRLNLAAGLAVGALLLIPGLAQAHFLLKAPTNWWNQDPNLNGGGAPQKTPPCGDPTEAPTLTATNVVNVYQPGQAVTVTVTSTVAHTGWWRISLHQGAAATQTTSNLPDPPTMAATGAGSCTPAFINNPVWSPTQPVLADKLGIPANTPNSTTTLQSGTLNYQVMIPAAAQCSMASPCTLQVMMIMTDHTMPGQCNYHHCANMAAAGSATGTGGMTGTTDAGTSGQGGASGGTGGKTGAGGSMTTGAGGSSTGTAGMTGSGSGGAIAGSGGTTGGGAAGSTTTGAGGAPSGGQDSGTIGGGGSKDNSGGCAIGGGALGSSSGLIFLAILALRRRRAKK